MSEISEANTSSHASPSTSHVSTGKLPSISSLFSTAWNLTRKVWKKLLVFQILAWIVSTIITTIFYIILALTSLPHIVEIIKLVESEQFSFQAIPTGLWWNIGIVFTLAVIFSMFLFTAFQIAFLKLVDHAYRGVNFEFYNTFKWGLKKAVPFVFLNLFVLFLAWGGLWLALIPGLIFSILMYFAAMELVLEDKGVIQSIRTSMTIVKQNFWGIFGRHLLFMALIFGGMMLIISMSISFLTMGLPEWIYNIGITVASFATSFFALAFMVVFYRQVKTAAAHETKTVSIFPIFVLSILGWVIAVYVIGNIVTGIKEYSPMIMDSFREAYQEELDLPKTVNINSSKVMIPTGCGVSLPHPTSTDLVNGEMRAWHYEERSVTAQNFIPLAPDAYPRNSVLLSILSYKTEDEKILANAVQFNLNKPGVNVYCIDNPRNLSLDEYVNLASANNRFEFTNNGKFSFGELEAVQGVFTETINGAESKNFGQLAVSKDGSKLIYLVFWGAAEGDSEQVQIKEDLDSIISNIMFR